MSITIIDAVVFVMFIVGILVGWRRGLVTEIVAIIGLIAVLVISWLIKSQVSVYFYKYLPFFNFAGPIKGITSLNILLYELLSFCLIITVLGAVLGIIMKVTGLFEKVLRVTVLLSFPSKVMMNTPSLYVSINFLKYSFCCSSSQLPKHTSTYFL